MQKGRKCTSKTPNGKDVYEKKYPAQGKRKTPSSNIQIEEQPLQA